MTFLGIHEQYIALVEEIQINLLLVGKLPVIIIFFMVEYLNLPHHPYSYDVAMRVTRKLDSNLDSKSNQSGTRFGPAPTPVREYRCPNTEVGNRWSAKSSNTILKVK